MSAEFSLTAVAVVRALLNEDIEGLAVLLPDGLPSPAAFRPDLALSLNNLSAGWPAWAARRTRWPRSRKPSPSAGSWPPGGPMSTRSWNGRWELLPGSRRAETSAIHLRQT